VKEGEDISWPDGYIQPPTLVSVGPATSTAGISALSEILVECPQVTSSAAIPVSSGTLATRTSELGPWPLPSSTHCRAAASVVKALSCSGDGSKNFNFAAAFSIPPLVPFFPVAKHEGPDGKLALGIGL